MRRWCGCCRVCRAATRSRESLQQRGALMHTRDLDEAVAIANRIAPEHLELAVADPDALLPLIRHAGAIFVGASTSEALGDYVAGPSHVLPTFGTARFASPLGVVRFQKAHVGDSLFAARRGSARATSRRRWLKARGSRRTRVRRKRAHQPASITTR